MTSINSFNMYNKYSTYSNLLNSTFGSGYGGSSSSTVNSLLNMYSYVYGDKQYGANSSTTSAKASQYIVDVKEESGDILSTLDSLTKKGKDSLFNQINAKSDSDSISVNYNGEAKDIPNSLTIDVSQIAQAQKNEGSALKSVSSSLYKASSSLINITTNEGKTQDFYISANVTDKNIDIQKKLASKINNAKLGITATVEENKKDGTSKLILQSSKTGSENGFNVSGGMAEAIGITNATKSAQDAVYSINGGEQKTSSKNNIDLGKGVTANLKKETDKPANISFEKNDTNAVNATRKLVNNFNELMDTAENYNDKGAKKLLNQLKSVLSTYSKGLEKIGITKNKDGYLQIDEDKMKSAAEKGELSKFFGADKKGTENYGFAYRLNSIAKTANNDPTNYLSSTGENTLNSQSNNFLSYNNSYPSQNYINSYYRFSTMGLLFDSLF